MARARDPAETSDEALMAAYLAGDLSAHRELFARIAPALRVLTLRLLRDEAEAEDIVQQTFLQVHRARRDYRPGSAVRPWIFTIGMNLARDGLRRRGRRQRMESKLTREGREAPRPGPLPGEREEEEALLREALADLPHDQRRAVELHWLEERPFSEVAALEGVSEGAVKVRAHRGYRRLRDWLETKAGIRRT